MTPLKALASVWILRQAVVLTPDEFAGIDAFVRRLTGDDDDALVLTDPTLDAPVQLGTKRRLGSASEPQAKRVQPEVKGQILYARVKRQGPDTTVPRAQPAKVDLHVSVSHRGTKAAFRTSKRLGRGVGVHTVGMIPNTRIEVTAAMWDRLSSTRIVRRDYRIEASHPLPFPRVISTLGYHPSLTAIQFGATRVILSTRSVPGDRERMPVFRGLHVYAPFYFDSALERFVVRAELALPRTMWDPSVGDALVSTPFTLAFPHVKLVRCGVIIKLGRSDASDDPDGALAEPQIALSEILLVGEWQWHAVQSFALRLWTVLSRAGGLLSWHTDADEVQPALDADDNILDTPDNPAITLHELDELLGGWDGWRIAEDEWLDGEDTAPVSIANAWVAPRLAGYVVDIDTTSGIESSATVTVYADSLQLHPNLRAQLTITACVSRIVVLQPWDPAARTAYFETFVRARIGNGTYRGVLSLGGVLSIQVTNGFVRLNLKTGELAI
jgi:hypothetical protein